MAPVTADLFLCEPYRTKLTAAACAKRWWKSRQVSGDLLGATMGTGSACAGCPVGKAHAAGQRPAEDELVQLRAKPPEAAPPTPARRRHARKPVQRPRKCPCGVTFEIVGPSHNQRYCTPECPARPQNRPAPPRAVEEGAMPDQRYADKMCPCGTSFSPKSGVQKYCTTTCPARGRPSANLREPRECEVCGASYTPTGTRQKRCSEHLTRPSRAARPPLAPAGALKSLGVPDVATPARRVVTDPVELLRAAGFDVVTAVRVPAGVALVVGAQPDL